MFGKNLGAVAPFISEVADNLFANINGESFNDDWSFLAALRAILFRRMPEGNTINLSIYRKDYGKDTIHRYEENPAPLLNDLFGDSRDAIRVINYRADDETIAALFKLLDDEEKGYAKYSGSEEQKDIDYFVKNYVNVRFYTNREKRSAVILVQNMDLRKYHFIQCFIPRALPWYFDGEENTLDEQEAKLIRSFREKYAPEYEAAIAALGERFDFRNAAIKMVLGNFERYAKEAEVGTTRNTINDIRRQIADNEQRYKNLLQTLYDANIRLNGLLKMASDCGDESELIDYFNHNKAITPISTQGTALTFIVKTFIELWDENMYEKYAENGVFYRNIGGITNPAFVDVEKRKRFAEELFSDDPQFRVKVCGIYTIDMRGDVNSVRNYTYPADCADYLPNPHLQIFACIGTNRPHIKELLRNGDPITAIEQCIASSKGLNLSEVEQTIQPFMKWIFNSTKNIIRLNDGSDVTPAEALEWLDEQKKKKEEDK